MYQQLMQAYAVLDRDAKLMSGRSRAQVSRAAQRKWLAFRDADCSADEVVTDGTVSRVAAAACLLDHTVARVLKLERSEAEAREALLLLE